MTDKQAQTRRQYLKQFEPRRRQILAYAKTRTNSETALKFGISRERVRILKLEDDRRQAMQIEKERPKRSKDRAEKEAQ